MHHRKGREFKEKEEEVEESIRESAGTVTHEKKYEEKRGRRGGYWLEGAEERS